MGSRGRRRRQRIELTGPEAEELRELFAKVPVEMKEWRLWTTEEGKAFIARATAHRADGVPVAWMAEQLELDDRILLQILHRDRRSRRRGMPGPPEGE